MAEKLKDAEDQLLEAMFRAETIADDGFSKRVVSRIRRGIWVRRLALPAAILVGGSIALKPLAQLSLAATQLLTVLPQELLAVPEAWIPQAQMLMLGGIIFVAGMFGLRMIED